MPALQLPFSGGLTSNAAVFDVYCDAGGGTAVQGRSLGGDPGGYGGSGIVGTAEVAGNGVYGVTKGSDRDGNGGWGVRGEAEGGVGVSGFGSDRPPSWPAMDEAGELLDPRGT